MPRTHLGFRRAASGDGRRADSLDKGANWAKDLPCSMATDGDRRRLLPGKLPAAQLDAMLGRLTKSDPRVLIGPRLGEDAAVIEFDDRCLVVTTDPITFAIDRIGWYAVHVNANDVAVMGARPRWFFAVLLLPERQTTGAMVDAIFDDIRMTCERLDITVCGGHTEITMGLGRPIVVGQMLGETSAARLVRKDALGPGDLIVLTHGAAIEGTALLARERQATLSEHLDEALVRRAQQLLVDPGISVVRAAAVAGEAGGVRAMHDPTEGGIASGLYEMASAARVGLRVWTDRIPVLPETDAVCRVLEADPLRLVASGALLAGVRPESVEAVAQALADAGIPSSIVGEVVPESEGIRMTADGGWVDLVPAERDEVARILEG
jgi:hydrogenase expression/formation protein HypE